MYSLGGFWVFNCTTVCPLCNMERVEHTIHSLSSSAPAGSSGELLVSLVCSVFSLFWVFSFQPTCVSCHQPTHLSPLSSQGIYHEIYMRLKNFTDFLIFSCHFRRLSVWKSETFGHHCGPFYLCCRWVQPWAEAETQPFVCPFPRQPSLSWGPLCPPVQWWVSEQALRATEAHPAVQRENDLWQTFPPCAGWWLILRGKQMQGKDWAKFTQLPWGGSLAFHVWIHALYMNTVTFLSL